MISLILIIAVLAFVFIAVGFAIIVHTFSGRTPPHDALPRFGAPAVRSRHLLRAAAGMIIALGSVSLLLLFRAPAS